MTDPRPITLAILGAGLRGSDVYGRYALDHPAEVRVVAVAEPDLTRRQRFVARHRLAPERAFGDWQDLLSAGRLADALVIATPDRLHVAPTLGGLKLDYDVLVEKPIAPTEPELEDVARAASASRGSVTVAHVLRHAPFFARIRALLDEGRIGRLMAISHHENVGYWHFAHSFVRGNWRRAALASPMLLAKACHDLDLLHWFAGAPCTSVASVGGLSHFKSDNAPDGAPARCTDGCPVADECPFYAPRIYLEQFAEVAGWPVSAITDDASPEGRLRALRDGPYGRCVYRSDNDVADHQQVLLGFANGVTATLAVSAFTADNTRTLKLMGTRGEIRGRLESGEIELRTFQPAAVEQVSVGSHGGHSGGDEALMAAFCSFVRSRRAGEAGVEALTSLAESLESHRIAFAAERDRIERAAVRA